MNSVRFQQVLLSKLYLDNKNPRHDPIDNEPEIISSLVRSERVTALARNIAAQGLSPLERVAVIEHPLLDGSYVVVEGNRRVCALKLLRDPEKAPSSTTRNTFAALASDAAIPAKIDVAIFSDAASARHWMSVRHEGEQGGIGTRKWNAAQKARFNAQGGNLTNPNSQALLLLDYAEQRGLVSAEERSNIRLTTLTRYLSNPVVRNAIGLASPKSLTINALNRPDFSGGSNS